MEPFGARLKAAREARGRSLRDIAGTTKISVAALEAVARNDFSKLPGGIFGRAFMRAYAIEVGLDPDATVKDFVTEVELHERNAARKVRAPEVTREDQAFLERQRQAARLLRLAIVVLIVAAIAFAIWRAKPLWSGAPVPTSTPTQTPVRADYRPPPPATPRPTPPPAAPSSASATPGPAESRLAVEFDVISDCWVQVSADGLVVLERLLKAGERQQFSADHEIALDVGNAGAFTWSINGKPAKPLGKAGTHKQVHITLANVAEYWQQ
jgi:cytoskeletal protein RodZ